MRKSGAHLLLLALAVTAAAKGAGITAWAAQTENSWMLQVEADEERLQDDVLEYGELEAMISRYNPTVQEVAASFNSSLQEYADAWSQLRFGASSSYIDSREARRNDDAETSAYYSSERAIYQSAASTYKTMYENLLKPSSTSSLRSTARQMTVAAQSLMISYETLRLQQETLTQQLALYEKALELAQTKAEAGLAAQTKVLEAQSQVQSARSALAALEESMDSTYSSLCLSVGREADGSLSIAAIPEADVSRAEGIDLEADTEKAIGNNTTLISRRHQSGNSTAARISRNGTVDEGEQQLTVKMKSLYEDILQKKAELEAAQTGMEKAEGERALAQTKYEAGLLNQEEYLQAQMDYIEETASWKAADLAFTQAADTYDWAVRGEAQLE